MNISEFIKPAKDRIAKVSEALDTLYGFKVYDVIDIKKLYDVKKDLKTKIKELEASLPFNSMHSNPKYMQTVLLREAVENMINHQVKNNKVVATEELTAKQKKLPAGLQKAIAKKSGDKEPEVEEKTEETKSDKKEKAVDKVQEKYTYIKKLIEQEVEKAEIVIAAKSIVDELQDMIEQMGKLQNDELGAIVDQMSYQYGADAAANFNSAVASQLETLLSSIKTAKEAVNNEVLVLTGEAPSTSDTDMAATDSDLGDMGTEPEVDGSDIEAPVDDLAGGTDAASGPVDEPLGRAAKA